LRAAKRLKKGNDGDLVEIPFSIALLPSISTGYADGKRVKHNFSINFLADYSDILSGAAMGGVNMVGEEMQGFLAGFIANSVAGKGYGIEYAGIFNYHGGYFGGIQSSGIFNYNKEQTDGAQFSGIFNYSGGDLNGVQLAFINISANMKGTQMGFINISDESKGVQIGFVNTADNFYGSQIGFINIADQVSGVQLGFINIADQSDWPIGFISIIREGQHNLSLWVDQLGLYHAGIKLGGTYLFTSFFAGADQNLETNSFGFSIGAHIPLGNLPFFIEAEGVSEDYSNLKDKVSEIGALPGESKWMNLLSFKLSAGLKLNSYLSIVGGVSVPILYSYGFQGQGENKTTPRLVEGWKNFNDKGWKTLVKNSQFFIGIQLF